MIKFEVQPYKIKSWLILRLPEQASKQLPSRGMTYARGKINGQDFQAPLEPDGRGSHWFRLDDDLQKTADIKAGENISLELEVANNWPRPEVLPDLQKALDKSPKAKQLWDDITPKAQWEWTRWIRGVKQAETRDQHVKVAIDKLNKGMRRPCCFNAAMCSEPYVVSSKWQLELP